MANTMDALNSTIQQLLTEKTLSLEALPHIQKLKDTVAEQEKQIEILTSKVENHKAENRDLSSRLSAVVAERDRLQAAETALSGREARIFALEKEAAVAEARSSAYRDSMAIVFAPNAVRQRVQAMSGHTLPNGQYANQNEDSERTVVEGYSHPRVDGQKMSDRNGNATSL